jgi:predicted nucleotidyltransferase
VQTVSEDVLNQMTQCLVEEFQPEQIILFGSYAWGTPNEHSDIDLLVIVPHSDQPPTQRMFRAYRSLRSIIVPTDVLVRTRDEVERARRVYASLTSEILEHGKVLYG